MRLTILPGVGRPSESLSVTVIVSAVVPSAGSVSRLAMIEPLAAGGTLDVRVGVASISIPSVVSVAVRVTSSTVCRP
jgi:hypothetical protein